MAGFQTLTPIQRARENARITQRDILPTATRRRHQVAQEREFTATVSPSGKVGPGDFSNIQEAINFVNNEGGGTVLLKSGIYILSSSLIMKDNVSLIGEDRDTVILDFNATTANQISIDGIGRLAIGNMEIKNCRTTTGAINIKNSTTGVFIENIEFTDNTASDGTGYDIYLENDTAVNTRINVFHCESNTPGHFIFLDNNGVNCTFAFNRINSPLSYTFEGDTSNNSAGLFLGNEIVDSVKSIFYGKFAWVSIIGCTSIYISQTSTEYQIDLTSGSHNVIVSASHFSQGGNGGMRITSSIGFNQISGSNIAAGSGHGIFLTSTNDTMISGCRILGAGSGNDGLRITTGDENCVSASRLEGDDTGTTYGINITNVGSNNNVCVGNRLRGNTAGSNDSGTDSVIASNS